VALYAALPDELPTRALFEGVVASGRAALLPRILPGRKLEFCPASRWGELRAARYGVLTPPADSEPLALEAGDLVLVPGLAFDLAGGRLGQGGGYYDRAFAREGGPFLCGVAYAFQLIDAVPCDSHDRRMDAIVTERGLHESMESG
jgi:5-formyltetrahydrofolate cyclo-ligase